MKSVWRLFAILMVAAMVLTACAPAAAPVEAPAAPAATEAPAAPAATEAPAAPAEPVMPEAMPAGQELANAFAGLYKGTTVTMEGPFVDADAVVFDNAMKEFEDKTGIDVQYTGSKEFEASITIKAEGGSAPDIADFPQPGLLSNLVAKDLVVDLTDKVGQDWLKENYNQSWLDMATMEASTGPIMAGIWNRTSVKSLVWYPKAAFDEAGYKVPATWDELMTLTETIAADGDTPWCIGIESGAATGWPMTDWIEDTMLRTTTPENYDKWVKGELKFDSPEVRAALEPITNIWFKDEYVYGGRAAIATTAFGDSTAPMFENPPKCWLHRQANFITSFFPEGSEAGKDYSFFYLPPIDATLGKPVLVAGDIYAMFHDRPEVRAVMQYFSMADSVKGWVTAGAAISPHKDSSLDWYTSDTAKGVAQILLDATAVRFDGSDLMPSEVGGGTFWKYMSDYVTGAVDLDTALSSIDASYPTK